MIAEIILSISLLLTLSTLAVSQYLNSKERKDLIRALITKNLQDLNTADAIDKMPKEEETKSPDLIPIADANDDLFAKMVKEQNKAS